MKPAATSPRGSARALVVDDFQPLCEVVALVLRESGFEADTAFTFEEALAKVGASAYDLIIADWHTGESCGSAPRPTLLAAAQVRAPGVKLITTSGLEERPDKVRGHAFLLKPFTNRSLLGHARRLIGFGPASLGAHAA